MKETIYKADFCVVGGGMAGLCAAVAAARKGIDTILVQDRPVLGGNASSEIRMHICGAHGENMRETGILEEIKLENRRINPLGNWSIWDAVLLSFAKREPHLKLLLNCSILDAVTEDNTIQWIKGWQLTTYRWYKIEAEIFADCSGDSILAPLSGAEFVTGRESRKDFNEDIAPEEADNLTMGHSCLIQGRETEAVHNFTPPDFAKKIPEEGRMEERDHRMVPGQNYWWLETGGTRNTIDDTEEIRDDLLALSFGVFDHIKNLPGHDRDRWILEWAGFLPGKRESRRYKGKHILTANDIREKGKFNDTVAYGGWSMDDHFPEGFDHKGFPTIFHPAPSPYGIPYRCLYSRNIRNLLFAGRNISATHAALSSTRVMGTCAILGQAAGTAAAIAVSRGILPGDFTETDVQKLQQTLLADGCYLPEIRRDLSPLNTGSELSGTNLTGEIEVLKNGFDRPVEGKENRIICKEGSILELTLPELRKISGIRIAFDTALQCETDGRMPCIYTLEAEKQDNGRRVTPLPESLVKEYSVELKNEKGSWEEIFTETENIKPVVHIRIERKVTGARLKIKKNRGSEAGIFGFDFI